MLDLCCIVCQKWVRCSPDTQLCVRVAHLKYSDIGFAGRTRCWISAQRIRFSSKSLLRSQTFQVCSNVPNVCGLETLVACCDFLCTLAHANLDPVLLRAAEDHVPLNQNLRWSETLSLKPHCLFGSLRSQGCDRTSP